MLIRIVQVHALSCLKEFFLVSHSFFLAVSFSFIFFSFSNKKIENWTLKICFFNLDYLDKTTNYGLKSSISVQIRQHQVNIFKLFLQNYSMHTAQIIYFFFNCIFLGHQIEDKLCQMHTNFAHYCGVKLTDNRQKIWLDKIYSFVLLIADTNINTNASETDLTSNKNRISQRKKAKSAFAEVTFVCSSKEKITT